MTRVRFAGELADYLGWQQTQFGTVDLVKSREKIWQRMLDDLGDSPLLVVELGVAWGYATDWWITRLKGRAVEWHGFDTFTGLPDTFRNMGPGTFSAEGQPPAIHDSRITWHVGLVEETLKPETVRRRDGQTMLVLFDLDLDKPSKHAWDILHDQLQPGDFLCFDEAFDNQERQLLNEDVIPGNAVEPIGTTSIALGLRVVSVGG